MKLNTIDFKGDTLFKYVFSSYDEDTLRLIALLFEDLFNIKVGKLHVANSHLIATNEKGKEAIVDVLFKDDQSRIYHLEMQNYGTLEQYLKRLKFYISSIIYHLVDKGEDIDDLETIYSVSFLKKIYKKHHFSLFLKSTYIDSENNLCQSVVDDCKILVRIANIKKVVKKKEIMNLNNFETIVYILYYGLDSDIMKLNNEVVKIMWTKLDLFTKEAQEDLDRIYARSQEILYQDELREQREIAEKKGENKGKKLGKKQGIKQGIKQGQNTMTLLFQKLYENHREEDMQRAFIDEDYRLKLLKEYHLMH